MTSSWTPKDERMYVHIKESTQDRGADEDQAEEIAARTVNKHRREEGRTPNRRTQGTGNLNTPLEQRSRDELQNLARELKLRGRSTMRKGDLIAAIQQAQA